MLFFMFNENNSVKSVSQFNLNDKKDIEYIKDKTPYQLKERGLIEKIFGGVGTNIFNPALTARAFMYFAFPTKMSGDKIWAVGPDGYTGATALSIPANPVEYDTASNLLSQATQFDFSLWNMCWGLIPGSIGETNKILILFGAIFLVYVGIASWRTMVASVNGLFFTASLYYILADFSTNAMLSIKP